MTGHGHCEVVISAPEKEWLERLCADLVERRLASSAHVVAPITSIYRWEGKVHRTTEARAFLRTVTSLADQLTAFVVERHPYEVPNVTVFPIAGGNRAYLDWIVRETR